MAAGRGHQRGLCRPRFPQHRAAIARHHGAVRRQGRGHLWPVGDPVADQQRHRRQQPAPAVCEADARERRLFFGPAFVRIPRPADRRRHFGHPGAELADHRGGTRSAVADRPRGRHADAGSLDVAVRGDRRPARNPGAAQAGAAGEDPGAHPVHQQFRHPRDHAGIAAGHPHGEGLHPRRHHARAHRRQYRRGGAQRQQDGAGLQPLQPADGNARRLRHRCLADLWRLWRGGEGRNARTVLLVPDRVPAGV